MDVKDIEKLEVYNNEENRPSELYVFKKDGSYTVEKYNYKSEELAKKYLEEKGMTLKEAMNQGLITVSFDKFQDVRSNSDNDSNTDDEVVITPEEEQLSEEEIDELLDEELSEEELEGIKKDGLSKKEKLGIIAAVLGISAATGVIIAACNRQQKTGNSKDESNKASNDSNIDFEEASFEELMDEFAKDDHRRVFSENIYDTVEKLNNLCLDKSVFALDEDKDAVLQFSTDEIIAAKLVMNNYDIKDLKDIFGTKELSVKKIIRNYESFASKMMIYSMNAKAPSGVSTLIESESNRQFFEDIENSIVKFNKNVNQKNANNVIKTFAYYYSHGIDGVNGIDEDLDSIAGVQNLCLNMISGYYDANVEKDYSKYLVFKPTQDDDDYEFRNVKLAQLQDGEKLKFYKNLEEKGNCTIDDVEDHLKEMINKHNLIIISMAEKLVEEGKNEEAESVLAGEGETVPTFDQIKNAIDNELGPFIEVKDDVLYGNRIRGLVKIEDISNTNSITASEWNSMSSSQKREFARTNGTVIRETTSTTETKVPKSSLSQEEQRQADEQIATDPSNNAEIDGTTYTGNTKEAATSGWTAATNYAEEVGGYSRTVHDKLVKKDNSVIKTRNTLSDVQNMLYAFEGVVISTSDSQIQARLAKDIASYNNTHSDPKMREAYKNAWLQGIKQKINSAVAQGKITRQDAIRLYEAALKAAEEKNRQTTTESSTVKEQSTTSVKPPKEETTKETTTKETTTKESTTKETTTKESTTKKDTTPTASEEKSDNDIDPNVDVVIPDSDFIIVDENYDGEDTKSGASYVGSLTLDDIDEYVNSNSDKTLRR